MAKAKLTSPRMHVAVTDDNGRRGTVDLHLHYDTTDPYAVQVAFTEPNGTEVTWYVDRETLCRAAAGEGFFGKADVRITSLYGPMIHLHLSSPDGTVRAAISRMPVVTFLEHTTNACPIGSEAVNFDPFLSDVLGAAS